MIEIRYKEVKKKYMWMKIKMIGNNGNLMNKCEEREEDRRERKRL